MHSTTPDNPQGTVLEIQRMSTEDGPGLRTTVFLKGCPLRCRWCHNPESFSIRPQLQWVSVRCIGCRLCLESCPENALSATNSGIVIDRERCRSCGTCAEQCPGTALEIMGEKWRADALVSELLKDKAYFDSSEQGGVTLSGGEVTLQSGFAMAVLRRLGEAGVHRAIDTCGYCDFTLLEKLLPHTELVLFDLKATEAERHKDLTSRDNRRILDNFSKLIGAIGESGRPDLWVRTPIIPGDTDRPEYIQAIGRFLAENAGTAVSRWELCAFNNLCIDKYERLGLRWPYEDEALMTAKHMDKLASAAASSGVSANVVIWTGSTRSENASPSNASRPALRVVNPSNPGKN